MELPGQAGCHLKEFCGVWHCTMIMSKSVLNNFVHVVKVNAVVCVCDVHSTTVKVDW